MPQTRKLEDARLATALRTARRRKKLTQDDIAKQLGVSRMSVHRWETGDTAPQARFHHSLVRLLGLDEDVFAPEVDDITLGLAIQRAREAARLTRAELGSYIERSERTIGYWETGERRPNTDNIFQIDQACNSDVLRLATAETRQRSSLEKLVERLDANFAQLDDEQRAFLRPGYAEITRLVESLSARAVGLRLNAARS